MVNRRQFINGIGSASLAALSFSKSVSATTAAGDISKPLLLNQNENSLGMSPSAVKGAKAALEFGHRYPDDMVFALKSKIAGMYDLNDENIMIGNGSTGLINAMMYAVSGPDTTVVAPSPTYASVEQLAKTTGAQYISVPTDSAFNVDLDALERIAKETSGPVIAYIVTPNNPTGVLVPSGNLFGWIRRAPGNIFFLIDEAYHEYVENPAYESALSLVQEGLKNLYVTRTFSKIHGMAGMRIGYGFGHPEVTELIGQYYSGWNISLPGAMAAIASLNDQHFLKKGLVSNRKGKRILLNTLDELGLTYIPSQTNFVLHQISGDHAEYQGRMKESGILVGRYMRTGPGWNRVSIGTPDEMEVFTSTLKSFRAKGWV